MKMDVTNIFIRKTIGSNIGRIRTEKGLTQTRLAMMVGLDRTGLNRLESGRYNPSLEWLCALADGLDVPVVEFFSGLEDGSPHDIAAREK